MSTVHSFGTRLMGNHFEFSAVSCSEAEAMKHIDIGISEIRRIEGILTTYDESSQTNRINKMAGINPVPVDDEVYQLIERSIRISALTQGAFDITFGSIDKRIWNFDNTMTSLPDADQIKRSIRLINFRNVILDDKNQTVFLKEAGMRIGFGGIGKGYAADQARKVMQDAGCQSGIVNASGDLTVWGSQPNGDKWTIGIADPTRNLPFASLKLQDGAVATSGDYEKFITIQGKRYSHTINPKTGYPVTGIKSATVITRYAEMADAMATPLMVMGVKTGLNLVNQMNDIGCIIIDEHDKIHTSTNINFIK
jgi:FAD:protein FMN transferase